MTYEEVRRDEAVRVYITQADASMKALGFTEHSFPHVTRVAELADTYILIPMEGEVESLNAAIAATVLMFEAGRQRRRK